MVLSKVVSSVIIDDKLYCVDGQIGCLYRIRLTDWKMESLGRLKFEWNHSKVTDLFFCQNSIWCVPLYAKQVAQYHLDTREITYFYLEYQNEGRLCTVLRNDVLYMIPLKPSGDLVEFHIGKNSFQINQEWRKYIWQKNKVEERFLMAAYDGNVLIITQKRAKEVIQIDFRNFEMVKNSLLVSDHLYGIVWMNGHFYFTAEKERKIFIWNRKKNYIKEYAEGKQTGKSYLRPVALLDRILLTDGEIQYCFKDGNFSVFQEVEGLENMYEDSSFYFYTYLWKDKLILPPCSANMFLEIDINNYVIRRHIMELPLWDICISMGSPFSGNEKIWSLEAYLNMIIKEEDIKYGRNQKRNAYGTAIYKRILEN